LKEKERKEGRKKGRKKERERERKRIVISPILQVRELRPS